MSAHAECGPSGADRWMTCTASVDLIRRLKESGEIPERETSTYAAEGTVVHGVREECLLNGDDPYIYVGDKFSTDGFEFEFTDEMADNLVPGIDWLRERLETIHVEIKVRLDPWLPGQFGTMDSGGIFESLLAEKTLLVCDYKNGVGENVPAKGNRQMRLYALGLWHHLGRPDVERVLMVIDQPRAGGMKFWEIGLPELLEFGQEAADAFLRIQTGKTEFMPTVKGCRWCPVKRSPRGCPAYNAMMNDIFADAMADEYFELLDHPYFRDPNMLTPEFRGRIFPFIDAAKEWLDQIAETSLKEALDGSPDPGTKPVLGRRGRRFFRDIEKAESILFNAVGMAAYKPAAMVGITDIEKLVKPTKRNPGHPEAWEMLQALLDQAPAKPELTVQSDTRKPYVPIRDEFDDME